jgi:microcystin-dependent protein
VSNPFLAEIRLVSFAFAPRGWALCNGQILPINQNQALFSLMGTTYGGNGTSNFALPNLQSRAPMHMGGSAVIGGQSGEETHTLLTTEMPSHTHVVSARPTAATADPTAAAWAGSSKTGFGGATNLVSMANAAFANAGGSQPHDNMPPYLTLNFVIALQGIFPSRN